MKRHAVSDDIAGWIDQCFDWFDARFPPPAEPILPICAFFRVAVGRDHRIAKRVPTDVKLQLGFELPNALV